MSSGKWGKSVRSLILRQQGRVGQGVGRPCGKEPDCAACAGKGEVLGCPGM
nr:hypothetical protein RVX_1326 [Nitratidesulfovibrio sp. HK-II]